MDRKQVVLSAEETLRQRDFERKLADIHRQRSRAPLALVDTFGCQQNVADSQHIMGMLQAMGCEFTDEADRADIIVLNTCAIRDHAEKRVFGNLGALTHTKKKNPEQIICLCGCMAQRPEIAEKVRTSYRHVDLVFGPQAMWKFPELLYRVYTRRGRVFSVEEEHGTIAEGMPVVREGRTRAWVSIMYGCNNFCSYHVAHQLHLPVQSGCDRVLRAMNRPYDRARYLELITYARQVMPDLVLTSDVIIGFPGETEAEAMETVDLVRQVEFDALFTFIFSPRPGTPAAKMDDPVPRAEKQKWFDTLCAVQNEISARLHACYVGKTLRCLVDGETDDARWPLSARTAGGRLVHLVGDKSALGQYRDIKITDSNTWALFGEMV